MFTAAINTTPNPKTIKNAIDYNERSRERYNKLEDYYLGEHVILRREGKGFVVNNKTVTNFAEYIADISVGYLLGNPIEYQAKQGANIDPITKQLEDQMIANTDYLIAKNNSKFGRSYDYTYAVGNEIHTKAIDPRNAVMVYDDTFEHAPLFGILYTEVVPKTDTSDKDSYDYMGVIVVDKKYVYTYDKNLDLTNTVEHAFGEVPLNEYHNNENCTGDYEGVLTLIDAYNVLHSDGVNGEEQLIDAIMVLEGFGLSEEQIAKVKRTRSMTVPKGSKAEYLIKEYSGESREVLLDRTEKKIHKISMTPDMSDENFVGNSSGVAIRYKLIPFEQRTQNKENMMKPSLLRRLKMYANYLNTLKSTNEFSASQLEIRFKRNLPQNDYETSQMIVNLEGIVSKKTLSTQLSFVEDADAEEKAVKKENEEKFKEQGNAFGTGEPNNNDDDQVEE